MKATTLMKNINAPGCNILPVEVLQAAAMKFLEILLKMYNSCLEARQKVSSSAPSSYQPMSN